MRRQWFSYALGILLFALAIGWASWRAIEGSPSETGIEPDLRYHWSYHFNRNAIRDARISGKSLVALTESGNLLRFDLGTLTLTGERVNARRMVCLGSGLDGAILAASDDGTISRVDPATLEPSTLIRIEEKIRWVGVDPGTGGLLAVTLPIEKDRKESLDSEARSQVCRVHEVATGKVHRLKKSVLRSPNPSAVFLDSHRRLWIGFDMGEWGGGTVFVDLKTGALGEVKDDSAADNVFGFFEPSPGEVWAHGGLIHFSANWFIARVDSGKAEMIAHSRDDRGREVERAPGNPRLPVTVIFPGGADDSLLVLSFHELFRFHPKDRRWEKVHEFRPRYVSGRPDAMGSYPAIGHVLHPGPEPLDLILPTRLDGLIRYSRGVETRHEVPNQVGTVRVDRILSTDQGVIFAGDNTWSLRDGRWQELDLAPPHASDREAPEWHEHKVMGGPGGSYFVVSSDGSTPGRRVFTQWRSGVPKVLYDGRESWSANCFTTPDGKIWCSDHHELFRLEGSSWITCGKNQEWAYDPRVVSSAGPIWILHRSAYDHQLYRLVMGPGPNEARIEMAATKEKDWVRGILELEARLFLVATDVGLKSWRVGEESFSPATVPVPPRKVELLTRDGSGRIWMAGEGVWLLQNGALVEVKPKPQWESLSFKLLSPDPANRHGVVASTWDDQIMFMSATPADR